jgi:hypothetical protein
MNNTDTFLDRPEAADYLTARGLRVSKNTLQKLVTAGGGPVYRLFGHRAVYTRADLDAWASDKLTAPRCSTAVVAGQPVSTPEKQTA